ncbi:dual specificity protein phosphatase family protein [Acinetobacter shaoyimingii]|uniref:Dual specificity protein phosphatase family protein n=1 Tax=Acinetobacter shaoyimingii TaxID=2715164 RepID=A0A6G8RTM2_9GAMM|nr:dual specificity protein phosphatase family protein [Acinetobacter shaoyimingii]
MTQINPKLLIITTALLCSGCMQSKPVAEHERPTHWGTELNDQHNFYQVSSMLYRSEQPNEELKAEIQKHNIQVVINLRSRDHDQKVLSDMPLKLVHIPIQTWAINREDLLAIMQEIQRAKTNNQKVLIHCYHGSDRTGASIAMYRILFEGWKTEDAIQEMKHGGYGFHKIWVNIEKLFSPENIKWTQEQLSNPS